MLFVVLRIVLLVYLGLLLLLIVFQRQLIYYPAKSSERKLLDLAALHQLLPWRNAEGSLIGWRSTPLSTHAGLAPHNRLLLFHGNAGYALDREYFVQGFQSLQQGELWEIYLFEYPGYGARAGKPGEKAFVTAARAAFEELQRKDNRPLYLAGESLGCGVAAQLAGQYRNAVAGLFLVTPFNNMADVAAYHYPIFPVRLFLKDRYAADAALKKYTGSVAVLLVGRDEVVPARFGRRLYEEYSAPKRLWVQQEASHNTIDYLPDAAWWREVSDFLI
jgi:hypothetical protein